MDGVRILKIESIISIKANLNPIMILTRATYGLVSMKQFSTKLDLFFTFTGKMPMHYNGYVIIYTSWNQIAYHGRIHTIVTCIRTRVESISHTYGRKIQGHYGNMKKVGWKKHFSL